MKTMQTLYININNNPISPSDELVVMDYDLTGDFFFYLGERIGKGCNIQNENALITDFNTSENQQDYELILSQWNEIKRLLFGEEVTGSFNFELPSGYLHWLRYNGDYNNVYEANFSNGGRNSISIDLEDLYEDSVEALQRKIIRKLKRDDLYLEIDEIVFNDEAVNRKSRIVRTIQDNYDSIGFIKFEKWLQEHDCRCTNCERSTNKPNDCETTDKLFPLHNVILHETSSKSKSIKKQYLEQKEGLIYYCPIKGIAFIQEPALTFFSIACIENEQAFPKSWEKILGLKWGTTFNECSSALKKNNNTILWEKENDYTAGAWTHEIVFISADNNHVIDLGFMHGRLDHIRVQLYRCPFCHSNHIGISNRNFGIIIFTCEDCGRRYGDTPICPSCDSEDVYDDGSNYLQYTCNECGHNWGHDDTLECPECGSNDIENDGTDYLQYKCNECGKIWGDHKW